jgi:hypothetical protein
MYAQSKCGNLTQVLHNLIWICITDNRTMYLSSLLHLVSFASVLQRYQHQIPKPTCVWFFHLSTAQRIQSSRMLMNSPFKLHNHHKVARQQIVLQMCEVTSHHKSGKSKVRPRTGHKDPDGELQYSSTLSLTSAQDGSGRSTPRPGRSTPQERHPVLIVQNAGWAPQGWPGQVQKISFSLGFDPWTVQHAASHYTGPLPSQIQYLFPSNKQL